MPQDSAAWSYFETEVVVPAPGFTWTAALPFFAKATNSHWAIRCFSRRCKLYSKCSFDGRDSGRAGAWAGRRGIEGFSSIIA